MTPDDAEERTRMSGWEAMNRNLAADQVLAAAQLYAAGWRQLTVEHDFPVTADTAA